uniref:Carboxypeptidase n=1 Tax=Fagus sylvatica TaxID=28930 RepID=A0A2N9J656_FAGSY
MESKSLYWILLFFLSLSCFVAQTHGKKEGQTLAYLYRSNLKQSLGVDTSLFEATDLANKTNVHPQEGLKEKDRIQRLPGQPHVNFSQYGGYVTVDKSAGRAFYYYFVEAHHSKDSLPLLLWLNGAANVLFLESPAGVGFSYSNTTSDYDKNGDRRTATDNYVFLVNWLERFPEYKNRDFYISGESYAGHYVPQLAQTILYNNKKAKKTIINLKGIIIGNAVINDETDQKGMFDYLASHAIISDQSQYQIQKYCDFSPNASSTVSRECISAFIDAQEDLDYINIYNIYAPLCSSYDVTARPKKASIQKFDPCSNIYMYVYLNRPDVQEALHANVTKLTHNWEQCSDIIIDWKDSTSTIIPLLREFMANGLRVWIFSGDIDGRVPVTSTKYSLSVMKLPVKTAWYPWFVNGEVGGYAEVYHGNLTFATVREAGHQVPSYQPARALSLIKHFLDGTPLPNTTRH